MRNTTTATKLRPLSASRSRTKLSRAAGLVDKSSSSPKYGARRNNSQFMAGSQCWSRISETQNTRSPINRAVIADIARQPRLDMVVGAARLFPKTSAARCALLDAGMLSDCDRGAPDGDDFVQARDVCRQRHRHCEAGWGGEIPDGAGSGFLSPGEESGFSSVEDLAVEATHYRNSRIVDKKRRLPGDLIRRARVVVSGGVPSRTRGF